MLIVGRISGIDDFVFGLAAGAEEQGAVLRGAAVYVQAIVESAAWRIRQAMELPGKNLLFCAGGLFAIDAGDTSPRQRRALRDECRDIQQWLLCRIGGRLCLAVGAAEHARGGAAETWQRALAELDAESLRPWRDTLVAADRWKTQTMCGGAIRTPGAGELKAIAALGREMPGARWLVARRARESRPPEALGYTLELSTAVVPDFTGDMVWLANLLDHTAPPPGLAAECFVRRAFPRHVPVDARGQPRSLEQLAGRASGQPLLGVLRMDGDGILAAVSRRLARARDASALSSIVGDVDGFFSGELDRQLRRREWESLHTVFSWADEAVLCGPWDVLLDFADAARQMFARRFAEQRLTVSAGMSLLSPGRTASAAAEEAADLLRSAKAAAPTEGQQPGGCMAALGQVWRWEHHAAIIAAGRRLAGWLRSGAMARRSAVLVLDAVSGRAAGHPRDIAAGLFCSGGRRWRGAAHESHRQAVRRWTENLADFLDAPQAAADVEMQYLPAILRYAILAVRPEPREDRS